jgi:hypothetical protein
LSQRQADTLALLTAEVDCWVASASATGDAYLIPLSFLWTGQEIVLATVRNSPTGRNLERAGWARIALGPPRDVVIVEGELRVVPLARLAADEADAFARVTGFDPRSLPAVPEYAYYVLRPRRIQAWREANELAGRDLMRDGTWLS